MNEPYKPYSHPRWNDVPTSREARCCSCRHWLGWGKCVAFPDGIPREILLENVLHDEPYPGDQGLRYELAEKKAETF